MKKIFIIVLLALLIAQPFSVSATDYYRISTKLAGETLIKTITNATKSLKISVPAKSSKAAYPQTAGHILVTSDFFKGLLPTGHAALIISKTQVIEALSKGVVYGKNNWRSVKKKIFGLKVNHVSTNQLHKVIAKAKKQVGKKYNYNYLDTKTRNKFYCSHLIWAVFLDTLKINLDTKLLGLANGKNYAVVHPLELVASNKTSLLYYYAK